jgi:hypothetical protein
MLTAREQRFVNAYMGVAAGEGKKAAEVAGYSKTCSHVTASRLLKKPHIQAAIAHKQAKHATKAEIDMSHILAELQTIAFSDVRALFNDAGNLHPIHDLSDAAARALSSVEVNREKRRTISNGAVAVEEYVVKVKQWDKLRALEMIAKLRGMFPADKVEHIGTVPMFVLPVTPAVAKESE